MGQAAELLEGLMASRRESFTIESTPRNGRLDHFLQERYPAVSRASLQRLIADGRITINGKAVKCAHSPRAGELVEVSWPEPKVAAAQPEELPLEILYEDAELVVLNKAAGVVVHPAAGHQEHTLVNALLHHCAGQLSGIGGVARPGIVHRLDKETSGCLVVAKNDAAHLALSGQFQQREVEKTYHALLCGRLPADHGEIQAPIARHPRERKRMAVVAEGAGRASWTSYRVLERLRGATYVEARLHTGRTHQVRVHFQHLGCPLAGDLTYGNRQNARLTAATGYAAPRLMLHAWRLSFTHPATGLKLHFEAPLPPVFPEALKCLGPVG